MTSKYPSVDLTGLRTMSISDRQSKVSVDDFASPVSAGSSASELLDSLPDILAGKWIRTVIDRIVRARERDRAVVVAMGAHVIKCGLSPILIDLMRRGVITALALNGAGGIHDSEIALFGTTSEDVVDGMRTGMFGMTSETADFLNSGARRACDQGLGFGEALGQALECGDSSPLCHGDPAAHRNVSLLAAGYRYSVPVTVHVSIGSDIVHMHPSASGAAIGEASMHDYRILTEAMRQLGDGGVLLNIGSAVVLPEVVLKAITTLINLGNPVAGMTGVNLDFVQHYRSNQQIVARVREVGGEGISLTGHHELMIPLIAAGIIDRIETGVTR